MDYKNHEGYNDPTPHKALKTAGSLDMEEAKRMDEALKSARRIFSVAGFEVVERIVLRNVRTGKVYR